MSLLEKVVSAVKPAQSQEQRQAARSRAESAAGLGDWLSLVLEHHRYIEAAFVVLEAADDESERHRAQRRLATLLIGHANAEETVLYPALMAVDERVHASRAFAEEATIRTALSMLDSIPSMTRAYRQELGHLRHLVVHHMYEEESTWFMELKAKVAGTEQIRLSQRYEQEFYRYFGEARTGARVGCT